MLYEQLLQFGHWEAFLTYLWHHSDCAERSEHPTYETWMNTTVNKEDKSLENLFSVNPDMLFRYVNQYLEHLANEQPKGFCLRCNRNFKLEQEPDCQQCGWKFDGGQIVANVSASIELNEHLNARYVVKQIAYLQAQAYFEQLDMEARTWSEACSTMVSQEEAMRMELETRIANKEKRENLEKQLQAQDSKIKELEEIQKNTESLFLYPNEVPQQVIELQIKGYMLHAKGRSLLKFPIDLIMGVQKVTDGRPAKTINKTACFLFINENQWVQLSEKEWKADLFEIARGKISGDFYINCFSHLHKKECLTDFHYTIKRLTFPE
jgi:hypothetical protein